MVTIQFKSNMAQLRGKIPEQMESVDRNCTWTEVLGNPTLFNPEYYYVKSCNGEMKSSLHDKVSDYTGQFKRAVSKYVVYIHKVSQENLQQATTTAPTVHRETVVETVRLNGRRRGTRRLFDYQDVINGRVFQPQKRGPKSRPSRGGIPKPVYKEPEEENIEMDVEEEEDAGQVTKNGGRQPEKKVPRHVGFNYINRQDETDVSLTVNPSSIASAVQPPGGQEGLGPVESAHLWENFDDQQDDTLSQDSQDDGDVETRPRVVNRWKTMVGNGDIRRIHEELLTLKRDNKYIRVSRHMPFTMNILQGIFLDKE